MSQMSRRDFLKYLGAGFVALTGSVRSEPTPEQVYLELKTFTRSLLNRINSNKTQGDSLLSEELMEDLSTRIPLLIREWSLLGGIKLENEKIIIQYLLTIMEKETKIKFDFTKKLNMSTPDISIPFIGNPRVDQDLYLPDSLIGSTLGIAQISEVTYKSSQDYVIDNLVQRYNSHPEQRNQIQSRLLKQLELKSGTPRSLDFSKTDPSTIIREIITKITPNHNDRGAYTDPASGLEIAVITYMYHVDYITKTYNVNPESSEFRKLLFASWNAGLSRPRNAYLQYVIYSYGDQTNPDMIVDSFSNNQSILEMMGLTMEQIEATESFADENYNRFIDGNLSIVEIDMLTRIVIDNLTIAQEYGIQVGRSFEDTREYLISSFFETEDNKFFNMKNLNSGLVGFIEYISGNLQNTNNPYVLRGQRAAIPATTLRRTLLSLGSYLDLNDTQIPSGETTLDYVEKSNNIFKFLNPWNPNNP